ncbi:MAG: GAF domain-containing sensor histidine kinase [Burkholderiales bacterium]
MPLKNEAVVDRAVCDPGRIDALTQTGLLDTESEECFDRITRLAAKLLAAPVTFIALVDGRRDYYKSFCGFPDELAQKRELPGRTFCHHTIALRQLLRIDDTLEHPVYRDVPTVKSLGIRAYIGAPLTLPDGSIIGSLCAVDFEPRQWNDVQAELLTELAASVAREISLRLFQHEAQQNRLRVEQGLREREEILAHVAHDLRGPLSVLTLGTATLQIPNRVDESAMLLRMQRAGTQMRSLIEHLLEVESFRGGGKALEKHRYAAAQIVETAVDMSHAMAAQKNILLRVDVTPDAGSLMVDYARILRVSTNLISNAIKFSSDGSEIQISAESAGDKVRFAVRDSGCGIDTGDLPRIFERYWQAESADQTGFGLGLGIVKAIVVAHGGSLDVQSRIGAGSTFSFLIPRT